MSTARQGSIHLFRVAGIDVFLHWTWFLIAAIEIQSRSGTYRSLLWNVLEYLALFVIVLLHEFGHALACRQVGGTANRIMLWPLGGVAFVDPPQRPGATLWSIAAGPLVNVALLPALLVASMSMRTFGWVQMAPDLEQFVDAVISIDVALLIFNVLPIYPLDGGQILRSLLWFVLGRGRSLAVTTVIGFIGIAGFVAVAALQRSLWLFVVAVYMLIICWSGLKGARLLIRNEKLPRRVGFLCPGCRTAPPIGNFWKCTGCSQLFDTFQTSAVCPHCGARFDTTMCLHCLERHPFDEWAANGPVSAPMAGKGLPAN